MRLIERQPKASGCDVPPPQLNQLTSKHPHRQVFVAVVAVLKITQHANRNKKTSDVHDMTCLVLLEEQSDFTAHTFAAPGYRPGKRLPGSTVTDM